MPLQAATSLQQGLVTYLNYEQHQAVDTSGNPYAITHNNVASNTLQGHYTPVTSLAGKAGFYNRTQSAYSKIATSFGSTGSTLGYNFSVSAWYYLQPLTLSPSGDKRFFVYESDNQFELSFFIKGLHTVVDGGSFSYNGVLSTNGPVKDIGVATSFDEISKLGAWNHLVDTFSLEATTITKRSYLNGILVHTAARALTAFNSSPGINLGTYRDNNDRFWDGFLDEVGVWNRALTAEEVSELYSMNMSGVSLVPEPSRALLGVIALTSLAFRRRRS